MGSMGGLLLSIIMSNERQVILIDMKERQFFLRSVCVGGGGRARSHGYMIPSVTC